MARKQAKARSRKDEKIVFLEEVINNNLDAKREGIPKRSFSIHDLKSIKPLTYAQRMMFESYFNGNNIVANGSAGTGKTLCALYLALTDVLNREAPQDKIIIVRSPVAGTIDIGALPGTLEEKIAPYEAPYIDIINFLLGKKSSYQDLKDVGKIEFQPTAFIRGLTWDNAIIVLDECQNLTWQDINSAFTRCGENSKIVVCADTAQNDLIYMKNLHSGYENLLRVVERMKSFDTITFTRDDVVRSGLVKEFLFAKEDLGL